MRWFWIFLAVAWLTTVAAAQQPCTSPCDTTQVPWQQQSIGPIPVDGCDVILIVRTRVCQGTYELQVIGASTAGAGCPGLGSAAAVAMAMQIMVTSNMMQFPPSAQDSSGSWTWVVSRPACMQFVGGMMAPCESVCCTSVIGVVKRLGCDTWSLTSETTRSPWRACPPYEPALEGQPACTNVCNDLIPVLHQR
jgi:hypothetical protein